MNRRPPGLKLVKAIYGFLQHKAAEALSPRTLEGYEHDLNTWLSQVGDVDIGSITTQDLRSYLAWLRTDYKPRRVSGSDHPLAAKTLRNRWVTLAAFFYLGQRRAWHPQSHEGHSGSPLRGGAGRAVHQGGD